jgi:hypothetical protein
MKCFLFIFLISSIQSFGQCDDSTISISGSYDFDINKYNDYCPRFVFAKDGDTSKTWNHYFLPIDISQAPAIVSTLKTRVENRIAAYSGRAFLLRLKFDEVQITYLDSFRKFSEDIVSPFSYCDCKAKYVFYFSYWPDSLVFYRFSISLDQNGKVVSAFNFPSKLQYRKIDASFTYCKLIRLARKLKPGMDSVESIVFDYDKKSRRFIWKIFPIARNLKTGSNLTYYVEIDAAELTRKRLRKSMLEVMAAIE